MLWSPRPFLKGCWATRVLHCWMAEFPGPGPVVGQLHSDTGPEERNHGTVDFLSIILVISILLLFLCLTLCRGLEGPDQSRFTFYCERFGSMIVVLGPFYPHISLGCSSGWLEFPLGAATLCLADSQVLCWSDQPLNEIFFPALFFLFPIFLSFHSPSLSLFLLLPSFPLSPSVNAKGILRTFCWLPPPAFSAGHLDAHFHLTADSICSDTAGIILLEDNAHFIIFLRGQWVFLCHAKCSTWLKIWFPTHLSWHQQACKKHRFTFIWQTLCLSGWTNHNCILTPQFILKWF